MALVNRRPLPSALLVVASLLLGAPAKAAGPSLEYAVKANFLYKFAPFVTWPPQALGGSGAPFQVCIAGADPFGATLDEAVKGQAIGGRRIVVRRMQRVERPAGCHIVFVSGSAVQSADDMLSMLRGQPVLTVADQQLGTGGTAIRFVINGGRVRFVINRAAATQVGLNISSKLLGLAVAVED